MCGIAAVFSKAPNDAIPRIVESGLDIARHRGPDGRGAIIGINDRIVSSRDTVVPNWGIGHVRLAILDVSSAGHQPMSYRDESLWISYNGEVYNYLEIRKELVQFGYQFQTGTDTEVVLAAYDRWGEDCVQHFRGMFAFLIIDLKRRRVFAARDRLGIKPLYFWSNGRLTMVVSEPKQLKACKQFRAVANQQQIVDYLVDGVSGQDADQTFFKGLSPLPHAHTISWAMGELPDLRQARRYWSPSTTSRDISWEDAVEETRHLFSEAVQLRMRSDVPLGSCLSGGIDSSSIVGTITTQFGQRINTFSTCWQDQRFDEQHFIDAVNRHCETIPAKVFPSMDEAIRDFDDFVSCHDEPVGQMSQYAQYRVMRLAKENGITVVIDGQGGDEALCGYRKYSFFFLQQLLAQGRFGHAARHAFSALRHGDPRLLHFHLGQRYLPKWLRSSRDSLDVIFRPRWKCFVRKVWSQRMQGIKQLHEQQYADLEMWSLPVLLRYEDRNSMAHSIEARVPFVDHVFIEHCLTVPEEYFFRNGRSKRLLTEAVGSALPQVLHDRRCKRGFDTPQSVWMRSGLGKHLENIVRSSDRIDSILDKHAVVDAFRTHRLGHDRFSDLILFRIASLAHWLERFEVDVLDNIRLSCRAAA